MRDSFKLHAALLRKTAHNQNQLQIKNSHCVLCNYQNTMEIRQMIDY